MDRMTIRDRKTGEDRYVVEDDRVQDVRTPCVKHSYLPGSDTCRRCGRSKQDPQQETEQETEQEI